MPLVIESPTLGAAALCEPILRALPEWFGIPSATAQYIADIAQSPTLLAMLDGAAVGFLTWRKHGRDSAEIHVMGILPAFHRQGIGRSLLERAEQVLRAEGLSFLQVKTLSDRHPDAGYAQTRQFYRSLGFRALEEHPKLWGKDNPCLQMLKSLKEPSNSSPAGLSVRSDLGSHLPEALREPLIALLRACFPGYPERSFYKQIPHRRWLIYDAGALVGAVATDIRWMRLGSEGLKSAGVIDLCVAPSHRRRGLGAKLLSYVEEYAAEANCAFVGLFADDGRLYEEAGYTTKSNPIRYMRMDEDRSVDVKTESMPGILFIKALGELDWVEDAELDLLGYLY